MKKQVIKYGDLITPKQFAAGLIKFKMMQLSSSGVGKSLHGGPKKELPPQPLECTPEMYSQILGRIVRKQTK